MSSSRNSTCRAGHVSTTLQPPADHPFGFNIPACQPGSTAIDCGLEKQVPHSPRRRLYCASLFYLYMSLPNSHTGGWVEHPAMENRSSEAIGSCD